ncbi:MAG TPA: D-glucuronyl C5-epimerase family protein [Solirubrobacteraceae bacterium]|nr:D-glucuronyl C5-epimerase family protein [Solirubrobacteraceae bacterium]
MTATQPMSTQRQPRPSRGSAGFFSSARTFFLPVGEKLDPSGVRGYPIDMRIKADSLDAAAACESPLHVVTLQYALGCYERWLHGEGDQWLDAAIRVGTHMVEHQEKDGSWLHLAPLPHTFPLPAPWRSAMAQGEAASLLVRLFIETRDEPFASSAVAALAPMYKTVAEGGVSAELDGGPWFEEYPSTPPSYVLNGAIFALWGLRDAAVGLADDAAARVFDDGTRTLARNLWRFDSGSWSLYSLYPHKVRNVASSFYHDLHTNQLEAMGKLCPLPEFKSTCQRWRTYSDSGLNQARAFAAKVRFRLMVPRRRLARTEASR